jgi:histone H3/H4
MSRSQGVLSTDGKHSAKEKCDRLLSELNTHPGRKTQASTKPYTIQDNAASFISNYVSELAAAVIEDSLSLAKHRKSKEISADDVNLALSKHIPVAISSSFHCCLHYE